LLGETEVEQEPKSEPQNGEAGVKRELTAETFNPKVAA
jgi:hypothetical protein